nr:response regulator transcription factor [Klugiella xanthotipulae]
MNPISPIRVLVVDDQQLFCAGISLLINSQNDLTVVGMAHDGLAAVELAATSTPDVILMDVRMPLLNGIEATARILRAAGGETPPPRVVVLTTFQRDGAVAHAIRAGASGFLLKDAHPDFVLASIRAVHEGQSVIAASATADILRHNSRAADAASPSSRGAEEAIEILSPREKEIYLLVAKGLSNGDIARAAFIGETTVKSHVGSILTKLGVMSRAQIIAHAYDNRLIG